MDEQKTQTSAQPEHIPLLLIALASLIYIRPYRCSWRISLMRLFSS